MKGFLGIASMVTGAATGAAMALARRDPRAAIPAGAAAPHPDDVTRAIDAARERLRSRVSARAHPTPRAA